MKNTPYALLQFTFLCLHPLITDTHLFINVKNQVGEVLQETISSNVTEDVVVLEFQRSDGTLITQLVDFTKEVQILKALVLGEEERGQSQYQVMCFVCHINKDEFISSDAMSKLRQKNPGTVRSAETERPKERVEMDLQVDVSKSTPISKHILSMCNEAPNSTYTRRKDIQTWATLPGGSVSWLLGAVRPLPGRGPSPRCLESPGLWSPCLCHLDACLAWYPCGLKYCRSKDSSLYRCGIKTCKKCYLFSYYVKQKQLCLWDE